MSPPSTGVQSAIDLGTNTILMVTGRIGPQGSIRILDDAHAIARLGQGVDADAASPVTASTASAVFSPSIAGAPNRTAPGASAPSAPPP